MLTNIGHRFGHQSGLYRSSGQNSAAILIAYWFRVYLVFSKYAQTINIRQNTDCCQKGPCLEKGTSFFKNNKTVASLFSRKQGLGVPIIIKMQFVLVQLY